MIDFCTTEGAVTLNQEVDLIMQQIEVLFDTHPGDVIGYHDFGTEMSSYLFNPNIGNKLVESEVTRYIEQNVELFGWQLKVTVEFLAGTQNDILLLKVSFYKESDIYTRIYKVSKGAVDYL